MWYFVCFGLGMITGGFVGIGAYACILASRDSLDRFNDPNYR